jgi:hypothetical protein
LDGGHQISYTISGKRLHPNKFPAGDRIPKDAKLAIAKVMGVSVDLLESYIAFDDTEGTEVILFFVL